MAKAATPLTVTVTAKLVEKDRGSPPEIKKEEKYCYIRIQSAENLSNVYCFPGRLDSKDQLSFNLSLEGKWVPRSLVKS